MKHWMSRRRPAAPDTGQTAGETRPWTFGPADAAIAAGILTVTLGASFPAALYLRHEARDVDRQQQQSLGRTHALKISVQHLELRRAALSQLRRELTRYVAEVEAKPIVPWTTAVGEISRRRPHGLWTTRISGNGPHFRAQVTAERPDLVGVYTQSLRQSPYLEFAALPAGATPASQVQVVGRLRGE